VGGVHGGGGAEDAGDGGRAKGDLGDVELAGTVKTVLGH
jgi:hypothetical protein